MAPGKGDGGMPNDEPDDNIAHDAEKWLLRKQAQLMLDLFAEDCGRMPVILDEVREWARSQDERYLQFRVNHRLNVFLETYENTSASGAVPLLRPLSSESQRPSNLGQLAIGPAGPETDSEPA